MNCSKLYLREQVEGLPEVRFSLAGEADDDIGADGDTGHFFTQPRDETSVLNEVVTALHGFKDGITARLHRQVDLLADLIQSGDSLDELQAHIFRVIG